MRWIGVEMLVPPGRCAGTIAPRTLGDPAPTFRKALESPVANEIVHRMTVAPARLPITPTRTQRLPAAGIRRFAAMVALAFAITALGMFVAPGPTNAWSSGQYSSSSEKALVAMTNQSRAASGLKALKVDSTLTSIARSRSKDMIVRGYFSHNIPPSGRTVFSILDSKNYCYAVAGENIGWNDYPDDVATKTIHQMFMKSAGHRSNIMGKRWDVIGIGAYKGPTGKKMWTVLFADKCGSSGGTAPKPKPAANATAKPAPKPKATPKPTPRPTPVPTPVKTMPPEPTDPIGLGIGPGDRTNGAGADTTAGGPATVAATTDTVGSLRVVDPPAPPGLVESIVGSVTGFFFGG